MCAILLEQLSIAQLIFSISNTSFSNNSVPWFCVQHSAHQSHRNSPGSPIGRFILIFTFRSVLVIDGACFSLWCPFKRLKSAWLIHSLHLFLICPLFYGLTPPVHISKLAVMFFLVHGWFNHYLDRWDSHKLASWACGQVHFHSVPWSGQSSGW